MMSSEPDSALVWKSAGSRSPEPSSLRGDRSDDRPLALDGNPSGPVMGRSVIVKGTFS